MQQIINTGNFSRPCRIFRDKDGKSYTSNYRPISLLTSFSKLLENVSIQFLEYLNSNNIVVEEEFRFRTKTSTDLAIYKLLNEIQKALNSKKLTGGIFVTLKRLSIMLIMRCCCRNWNFMVENVKQSYGTNHIQ
jgi:hypothetical protein